MRRIGRDERAGAGRRLRATAAALLLAAACGGGSEPIDVRSGDLTLRARLEPAAAKVGANELELELRDAQGRAVEGADVDVAVRMDAMGSMPAMGGPAVVTEVGGGRYRAGFDVAMGGTWRVEVSARPRDGASARAEGSLTVGTEGLLLEGVGAPGAAPSEGARGAEPPSHEAHGAGAQPPSRGTHAHGAGAPPPAPGGAAEAEVRIAPGRLQTIGVGTSPVERRPMERTLRALGTVAYDETALADVSLKVRGWIATLRADAEFVRVERGEVLFTLYSPELYAAEQEYLTALRSQAAARESGAPDRVDWRVRAARKRLELWDLSPADVAAIERRGEPIEELPIRSPASGFVIEKNVAAGSAVEPGARLFRIVPLDRIWVEAEVYESELDEVAVGMPATVSVPQLPGRAFEGKVSYLYPTLSGATRTLRARIVLDNPGLELRPGMWATVRLRSDHGERLSVPQSALLYAGDRSFVFVELGEGRFRPREVEVGMRSGDQAEVLRGLEPGERVVTSGTFLVAAESRLRAALEDWR
jgi:Cu(I)/Ag(I) efflux system membrane fusion protein